MEDLDDAVMSEKTQMIAYCGLYCAECPSHLGVIADLARDLRKELRKYRYDVLAAALPEMTSFFDYFKHYPEAYQVLGGLVRMRCKHTCKGGGGPPFCKMRKCCQKKGYEGCWECDEYKTCPHLEFLDPTHGDAHRKNLNILKRKGIEGFLAGQKYWYVKPKAKKKPE
jgi:hypothetical protein